MAKGAIGAIPIVGGFVGELFEIVVVPQYQKKLDDWFAYVDETLKELIENKGVSKEAIFNDETFVSLFQRSSRVYMENVEAQKKPLLKAYLKAVATRPLELNKKYIFLDIIDKLTETQLMILKEIYDNENSNDYLYQKKLEEKLAHAFAGDDHQYLQLLIKGLQDFHLLGYGSAEKVVDGENQWHMKVSKIGKEFMDYLKQ